MAPISTQGNDPPPPPYANSLHRLSASLPIRRRLTEQLGSQLAQKYYDTITALTRTQAIASHELACEGRFRWIRSFLTANLRQNLPRRHGAVLFSTAPKVPKSRTIAVILRAALVGLSSLLNVSQTGTPEPSSPSGGFSASSFGCRLITIVKKGKLTRGTDGDSDHPIP